MTIAAALSLITASAGLVVALLALRLTSVPGWSEKRWFAPIALSAAFFGAFTMTRTLPIEPSWMLLCGRFALLSAGVHVGAWMFHSAAQVKGAIDRVDRVAAAVAFLLGGAAFVPDLIFTDVVDIRSLGSTTYYMPGRTAFGHAWWVAACVLIALPLARYLRVPSLPDARFASIALGLFAITGVHDSLVDFAIFRTPYILLIGFLATITATGFSLLRHFIHNAHDLEDLSLRLERVVEERTHELTHARSALLRAERLAALGQVAAAVAHEINNPTAVVRSNLEYLRDRLTSGVAPADAMESVNDALDSVQRVAVIVRHLLDSGRAAASDTPSSGAMSLPQVCKAAVQLARTSIKRESISIEVDVPNVWVRGEGRLLEQVLVNLIVNGAQAIEMERDDGRVVISATESSDGIRLSVEDNGVGMSDELKHRVFEPFFTTKPFGQGTGLGLSVSMGLVRSLGGKLHVDSEIGRGTRMTLDLVRAATPSDPIKSAVVPVATGKPRVLIVDDEALLLSALKRALGGRFQIEVASGVHEALDLLRKDAAFDVVLCDLMMVDGGGEALYRTLSDELPSLASRMIFISGGATTYDAKQFLESQPQPVLHKPVDIKVLLSAVHQIAPQSTDARPDASTDVARHRDKQQAS